MNDTSKTKKQLGDELARMRSRVAELEAEIEQKAAETQRQTSPSERHTIELSIVNEIGKAISSTAELDNVLEVVYQQVGRLFDVANFCISIYEEESDEWSSAFFVEGGQVLPRSHIRHEGGVGLTGCMIRDRQSLLFRSEEEIAAFQKAQGQELIGKNALSWLGVPLIIADKVVGGMAIQSYEQGNLYDERDEALFFTIATQVASALNNLRLLKETRQSAEELAVLNELGQALTARLSVEDVLDEAYQQAARLVDTTNFYIALYDSEGEEIAFAIDIEEGIHRPRSTRHAGQGITEYIIRNQTPLLIPEDVSGWIEEKMGVELLGRVADSWLGVPLIIGDRVLGVMAVQSYTTPRLYSKRERDLLVAIANQVAIALQNAYQFEETNAALAEARNLAKELTVMNELSRALTTCFTVDEVLEQTYEGASLLLDTTNFDIGLYDSNKNEVTFVYNITESVIDRQITTISADQGITGHIVQNRAPVLIWDDLNEWLANVGIEAVGEPARSWLGVPMMVGDQVLGVITVQSYTTPHLYDEHDQELLVAVGNQAAIALQNAQMMASLEQKIEEGMAELRNSLEERERLQQEVIEAQKQTLQELSTPIIPVMDRIIVLPLIGGIDAMRAKDITRRLLAGIREHRAKVVILDITGVAVVDSSVADHLNKTIQAARLKGAHTIVTGISDAVAGTIVDLGIDWSGVETLQDMQTGLRGALSSLGFRLTK